MDLNELFRCDQLALIAACANERPETKAAAECEADKFAAQTKAPRPVGGRHSGVLSSRTSSELLGAGHYLTVCGNPRICCWSGCAVRDLIIRAASTSAPVANTHHSAIHHNCWGKVMP